MFSKGAPEHPTQQKSRQSQLLSDVNWRDFAVQTNTRLLHVLSHYVKAFIDTERDIQTVIRQLEFGQGNNQDRNNNVSGSQEEILSSIEDALNNEKNLAMSASNSPRPASGAAGMASGVPEGAGDFCDDGLDLLTSYLLPTGQEGNLDITYVTIDDDVVVGASHRLRAAVDRILHLLKDAVAQQNESLGGRSSADSSVQTVIVPFDSCSRCEKLHEAIKKLEKENQGILRTNKVLQEELNSKHLQLSLLKSRIDNTSLLDMQVWKEKYEELREQLQEKDVTPNSSLSIEVGRDATTNSPSLHAEPYSINFRKSRDHFYDDELGSLSPVKLDEVEQSAIQLVPQAQQKLTGAEGGDVSRNLRGSVDEPKSLSTNSEVALLFQKIVDEKNQEIELLRSQMKLAQEMIATAFPNQTTDHELLDVELIEALVESHLTKKKTTVPSSNSPPTTSSSVGVVGLDLLADRRNVSRPKSPDSAVPSAASDSRSVSSSSCVNDGSNDTSFMPMEQLDGRLNQLYNVVESLMRTNNRIQDQHQQMSREKLDIEQQYRDLLNQTQRSRSRLEQLGEENATLRSNLGKSEKELRDLKRRTDAEMNHQLSFFQSSIKVKDEEIASLESRIRTLLRRIDEISDEENRRRKHESQEQTELKSQIAQLKSYVNQQQQKIENYELKVQSLLSKIEDLKLELDSTSMKDKKIKDLELQLKNGNEILLTKKAKISQLIDTLTKISQHDEIIAASSSSAATKVLIRKIKKAQHEKRALIFQKNYLTNVLSGFQITERATLALLGAMNVDIEPDPCRLMAPIRRFKSAVFAVMAIRRMKLLVKKWSFNNATLTKSKMVHESPVVTSSHRDFMLPRTTDHRYRTNESMQDFMTRLREIHESLGLDHSLSDRMNYEITRSKH